MKNILTCIIFLCFFKFITGSRVCFGEGHLCINCHILQLSGIHSIITFLHFYNDMTLVILCILYYLYQVIHLDHDPAIVAVKISEAAKEEKKKKRKAVSGID